MKPKAIHAIFVSLLLLLNLIAAPAWGQAPMRLQIVIIEGDGAINNIKQRISREPIVEVQDENHKPIAGAAVTFFLPNQGPGGTFSNGSTTLTTMTNAQGQATARGVNFNNQPGTMQIRVVASFGGLTANEVVTQTNVLGGPAPGASGGMSTATKWLIILGIAGAGAAAGAIAISHGGSSSSSSSSSGSSTTPTTTITPGTPTVGGPQ